MVKFTIQTDEEEAGGGDVTRGGGKSERSKTRPTSCYFILSSGEKVDFDPKTVEYEELTR